MGEHSEVVIDFESNTKFAFFRSFWEAASCLGDEDRLAFYDAIGNYAFTGTEPDFDSPMLRIAWTLAEPNVTASILDQTRGKAGGRPPKTKDKGKPKTAAESHKETPAKTPLKTPAETDKDKDRDMDRDGDTEREEGEFVPLERTNSPSGASAAPAAAEAAPPPRKEKPVCPMCNVEVWKNTQTGRWHCPNCRETFPKGKVEWRWA